MPLIERNALLSHCLIYLLIFVRIDKLIKFNIILKWHLLSIIELTWWILKVEKRTKFLILARIRCLFVRSIDLEAPISRAFSSFGHRRLDLFLLQGVDLFIDCLLVLLLLALWICLLLLLTQLPGMLQLISINLLKLLLEHIMLLSQLLFIIL